VKTFHDLPTVSAERAQAGKLYREFLRVPSLSVGLYVLPAGGTDPQKPHKEDEVYYVVRVAARVDHCFFEVSEELEVLVFFAPAESA
jgi:hypothetical protein